METVFYQIPVFAFNPGPDSPTPNNPVIPQFSGTATAEVNNTILWAVEVN